MVSFTVTREFENDPKSAMKVLDDFGGIANWSKGVLHSETTNGIQSGVGAERKCVFDAKGKQWLNEKIVESTATTQVVEMTEGSMNMKYAMATFSCNEKEMSVHFDYAVKGIMAPMGYLMKPMMKKTFRSVLADLDQAAS